VLGTQIPTEAVDTRRLEAYLAALTTVEQPVSPLASADMARPPREMWGQGRALR
jgi:hypothetical protein